MFRARMTVIALGVTLVGCGGAASSTQADASPSDVSPSVPELSEPAGTSAAIVGVWQGVHECEGIAEALGAAGFDEAVILENIVGNGLLPGVESPDEVSDITTACEEATPLEHSHEFTADGQFFSYDQDGEEVDFGTYELIDDDTLSIGAPDRPGMEFDFTIEGDHLTLVPQVPAGCLEFECQWAVMVAMPWSGMDRVEE
jgi:hypothetical protein